jgi:hypothetical protein
MKHFICPNNQISEIISDMPICKMIMVKYNGKSNALKVGTTNYIPVYVGSKSVFGTLFTDEKYKLDLMDFTNVVEIMYPDTNIAEPW